MKFTVPDVLDVTVAVIVTRVFRFCGPSGDALSVIDEALSDDVVTALLVADGPLPPELDAKTLKVYEVDGESPRTEQLRLVAEAANVQDCPPGLAVAV